MADDRIELPEGYETAIPIPEGYAPKKSTTEDVARSVGSGIAMAPADIAGTPGDLMKMGKEAGVPQGVFDAIMSMIPGYSLYRMLKPKIDPDNKLPTGLPTSEDIKTAIPGYKQLDYEPETELGQFGKTAGGFIGGAAIAPARTVGQVAANIGRFGIAPAITSETAGRVAHEYAPGLEPAARFLGAMGGSATASHFISPNASTLPAASRQQYAEHVKNVEDVLGQKVSPGERSNSLLQRIKEDEANPERHIENREAITSAATKAVAPEFETPVLTMPKRDVAGNIIEQGTLGKMRAGIGQKIEAVTSNPTNNLELAGMNGLRTGQAIANLNTKYVHAAGYDKDAVDALHAASNHVRDVLQANGPSARTGNTFLTAPQYQRMRSSLMDSAMAAEGQKKQALHDFIDVLDNSFDRSLRRYNPTEVGKIQDARKQWRAMLTVEKAAGRADVDHLTPPNLEAAAQQTYGKSAHLRGQDPFWWAPSAKAVLRTEANSNTARRAEAINSLQDWMHGVAAPIGYWLGHHGGQADPVGGLLMAEAMVKPLSRVLRQPIAAAADTTLGKAYLGNQVLAGAPGLTSYPGLLTARQAIQGPEEGQEKPKKPRLSITVGGSQ